MASSLLLEYDEQFYTVDAIQKAAYRSMNSLTADISTSNGKINCLLNPNIKVSAEGFDFAVQEFKKEVLDQQLRIKLKAETEPIRNLILGLVFSNSGLQGDE